MSTYLFRKSSISFLVLGGNVDQVTKSAPFGRVFLGWNQTSSGAGDRGWGGPDDLEAKLTEIHKSLKHYEKSINLEFSNVYEFMESGAVPPANMRVSVEGVLLQKLQAMLGLDATLTLEIENAHIEQKPISVVDRPEAPTFQLAPEPMINLETTSSPEMLIRNDTDAVRAVCKVPIPSGWTFTRPVRNTPSFHFNLTTAKATISLAVNVKNSLSGGAGPLPCALDSAKINRKLLQDEIRTDVEILAANGCVVKCHSAFLVVHCEVFKSMLESGMKESKTNHISMVDVSEEGVRALLEYLYCRDLNKPMGSSTVAVEMLEVAHKYLLGSLEDAIKAILFNKCDSWFNPNAAFSLFFFAGKLDHHKDLRDKAIRVLRAFPSAALECDEFRRLFDVSEKDDGSASNETEQKVNDPRAQLLAAKELCTALFEVKSDVLFRNGIVESKPSSFDQLMANLRK